MSLALVVSVAAVICYAGLAVLVVRRGMRIRVEQLFGLYVLAMLIWQSGYILVCVSRSSEWAEFAYRVATAAAAGQGIVVHYLARALLRIRERKLSALAGYLLAALLLVVMLAQDLPVVIGVHRDGTTQLWLPEFGALIMPVAGCSLAFLGSGLVTFVVGYRRATMDMERNRLRYLLLAASIVPLGGLGNFVPGLAGYPVDVLVNIASALLIAYAILRYRLFDITVVVRRGLAYSILTVSIAVVYLLSALLFEQVARAWGLGAVIVPVVMAIIAALLLRPWRERAQVWVDRLFFRDQYDSQRMMQQLSRQVATIIDLDVLGNLLLTEICDTMHVERAALFLREGDRDGFAIVAQRGIDGNTAGLRLGEDHPVVQWLKRSDSPLRSRELEMLPQFRSLWSREREELSQLGAQLFIPLQVKKDLVGILAVGAKLSGHSYSAEDEITLSTLANQAAVAVENAHLFATTKMRVAELTLLQEIGVRLVSARYLSTVLQVVAESGIRLLDADEAHVALYDAGCDRFTVQRGQNAAGEEHALAPASALATVLRMAVHSEAPTVIEDLWLHAAVSPALARESQVRAVAAQPLRRGDAMLGVLAVAYQQPHAFTEDELRLLGMLSDQATLAIDNAQLLESELAKRQLADTLREVSRVIGSTLHLDVLLNLVLEQLQNVVDYDVAAILLVVEDRMEVSAARGLPSTARYVGISIPYREHAFLWDLAQERLSISLSDIRQGGYKLPDDLDVRSVLGVPLIVRDEFRGILLMGSATVGHYSRDDLQNATAFANQATLAIENARLYRETITEKRKTETILEESLSGILVADVDLRIVTFNSGAEAITGFTAQEAIGRLLPDLLGDGVVAEGSPLHQVMVKGGRVAPQETVIHAATGLRDILQGAVALHDGNLRLFGYLLSFTDITRLKEVDRLKTDIVANVSHELRTPLASIKAYTELLLDGIDEGDAELRDQFLRTIDLETDHLSQLISDLLDLSRLEAGRFEVRKSTLNLGDVLADVLALLEVQRRGRQVTIRAEVPENLPELEADREMVSIIVRNLLANAIKFSKPGGEVLVALSNSPEHLVLEVTDHGIGIPADAMPNLFQKFYRSRAATENGIEGTGLGLVLTKQAVEAHGGTITVKSVPGVETTFRVCLPWH